MTGGVSGLGAAVVAAPSPPAGGTPGRPRPRAHPRTPTSPTRSSTSADAAAAAAAVEQLADAVGPPDAVVTAAGTDACGPLVEVAGRGLGARHRASTWSAPRPSSAPRCRHLERRHGRGRHGRLDARAAGRWATPRPTAPAKFGVVGFTRALATELAGGSASRCSSPAGCARAFFDGRAEQYNPGPDAQLNDPADVAATVSWPSAAAGLRAARAGRGRVDGAVLAVTRRRRPPRARARRPADGGAGAERVCRSGLARAELVLAGRPELAGWLASLGVVDDVVRRARPGRRDRLLAEPTRRTWRSTCTAAARRATGSLRRCVPGAWSRSRARGAALGGSRRGIPTSTRSTGGSGCRSGRVGDGQRRRPAAPRRRLSARATTWSCTRVRRPAHAAGHRSAGRRLRLAWLSGARPSS